MIIFREIRERARHIILLLQFDLDGLVKDADLIKQRYLRENRF